MNIPNDAEGVLSTRTDPGLVGVLGNSALIVTREIEMMNVFLGFEQANRYALLSPTGEPAGYLAEEEPGVLGGSIQRQILRTHRPFTATLLSTEGKPLLLFKRNITLINSKVQVYRLDPEWDGSGYGAKAASESDRGMKLIGESQQIWHPWRRKYDLFVHRSEAFDQFAHIDTGLLGWDFVMQDQQDKLIGAINRNFRGIGRELFTDTGQYVLRFDSVGQDELLAPRIQQAVEPGQAIDPNQGREIVPSEQSVRAMTLDERAVALATAVSVDFDYFSRHSSSGSGGMFPFMMMGGGHGDVKQGPPAEGAGQDSRGVIAQPGAPGSDGGGIGAVGTGVGYGMMGGGSSNEQAPSSTPDAAPPPVFQDDSPPQDAWGSAPPPPEPGMGGESWGQPSSPETGVGGEEVWGESEPWSGGGGGDEGGGGGGLIQSLWDMFGGGDN